MKAVGGTAGARARAAKRELDLLASEVATGSEAAARSLLAVGGADAKAAMWAGLQAGLIANTAYSAEDLSAAAEAAVRAWNRIEAGKVAPDSVIAYFRKAVTNNVWADRSKRRGSAALDEAAMPSVDDHADDVSRAAETSEVVAIVREEIAALPANQRNIIELRLAGEGLPEAARAAGVSNSSASTVSGRVVRRVRLAFLARRIPEIQRPELCAATVRTLPAFVQGDGDTMGNQFVEAHLAECAACAEVEADLRSDARSLFSPSVMRGVAPLGALGAAARKLNTALGGMAPIGAAAATAAAVAAAIAMPSLLPHTKPLPDKTPLSQPAVQYSDTPSRAADHAIGASGGNGASPRAKAEEPAAPHNVGLAIGGRSAPNSDVMREADVYVGLPAMPDGLGGMAPLLEFSFDPFAKTPELRPIWWSLALQLDMTRLQILAPGQVVSVSPPVQSGK